MANDSITRCLGLVTQYNPLTVAPGALLKADNCVIRRENVVEDRRGYALYATLGAAIKQLLTYNSRVLAHHGTALSYDDGSGTVAAYTGSYSAPTGQKMRSVEAFQNLYFTTSDGVKVIGNLTGTEARKTGAPRALDPDYSLTGVSGFLSDNTQCAYRVVLVRRDENNNILYGYPSNRMWVTNTSGGAKNVALTIYLPAEITAADLPQYTVQIYRTGEQVAYTATDSDAAGDDMHLVYQYTPTSTSSYSFTDPLVDDLAALGASLYTNTSSETILQANDRPPLAKDLALFKNTLFYANCETRQRLTFTMVGTSGLTGKTITIAGVTYNFGASEITSGGGAPQAKVSATGVAATDIDLTARSLVRVINRYASNTSVYAYYESASSELPGRILIEARTVGAAAFTIHASDATIAGMFSPIPLTTAPTSGSGMSSSSIQKNAIYYSKVQQPEAVPTLNYLPVGSANKAILRIAPLRDSLIVIKEDGVFVLRGESALTFSVQALDTTVFCKSADSVAVLANLVFMLSNQGVVAISDTGAQVISREIEPDILPISTFSNVSSYATGCGYESERSYLLSIMDDPTDTDQVQTYVYNVFTRTWVRWTFGFAAAIVEPSADKLYFAIPGSARIMRERKSFTDADYADPESAVTITAVSGTSVSFTSDELPQKGWVISQGDTAIAIKSFTTGAGGGYTAVLEEDAGEAWDPGAATLYPSVGMDIEWDNWSGPGATGILKQVYEFAVFTDNIPGNSSETALTYTFKSNSDDNEEEVDKSIGAGGGWGGSWGAIAWGGQAGAYGYRTFVPRNKQMCSFLNPGVKHKVALERMAITGCGFQFEALSGRIGR